MGIERSLMSGRSSHMSCSMHSLAAFCHLRTSSSTFTACLMGMLLILCSIGSSMADRRFSSIAAETPKHELRISTSDLDGRHTLERIIQLAAFQQFDSRRTGLVYNVSVPMIPSGTFQAIRVRSGSFRRYGVNIGEFTIPQGCIVSPVPERVLLVYAKLINTSLFRNLPGGLVLASPVLSVLVYDASNLSSSDPPQQISVSTTASLISIRFARSPSSQCAFFNDQSPDVNVTSLVNGVCQADHLGSFSLVASASALTPSPNAQPQPPSPRSRKKHSSAWKIVLGSVTSGVALLLLVTLLALGVKKRRKNVRLERMENQTDQGEMLQTVTVRNSRLPIATDTRTHPRLESEYTL